MTKPIVVQVPVEVLLGLVHIAEEYAELSRDNYDKDGNTPDADDALEHARQARRLLRG
jgi:hypothetical protein